MFSGLISFWFHRFFLGSERHWLSIPNDAILALSRFSTAWVSVFLLNVVVLLLLSVIRLRRSISTERYWESVLLDLDGAGIAIFWY